MYLDNVYDDTKNYDQQQFLIQLQQYIKDNTDNLSRKDLIVFLNRQYERICQYLNNKANDYDKIRGGNPNNDEIDECKFSNLNYDRNQTAKLFKLFKDKKISDKTMINNIKKLYQDNYIIHERAYTQSIDHHLENALAFGYDDQIQRMYFSKKPNTSSHVPAILSALFLPNIFSLDNQIIQSSIGRIIDNLENLNCSRQYQRTNYSDYVLLQSMITNPYFKLIDKHKEFVIDKYLFKTYELQMYIQKVVTQIRDGSYFLNSDLIKMLNQLLYQLDVSQYDFSMYDKPNEQNEGQFLSKLFNVFSYRPIGIQKKLVVSNDVFNTQQTINSSIPFIIIDEQLVDHNGTIDIATQLEKQAYYQDVETQQLKKYTQKVTLTSDVLIFYFDRSDNPVQIKQSGGNVDKETDQYVQQEYNQLVFGLQDLNTRTIDFNKVLEVDGKKYSITSVVCKQQYRTLQLSFMTNQSYTIFRNKFEIGNDVLHTIFQPQDIQPMHTINEQIFNKLGEQFGTIYVYTLDV